ncbi:ATP-dependent RNA helicase DbpA [Paraliobacillus sp. PM-2]|uniref:DEAD/DEAH box helicase n=1 Tax=Paraliobacillus sp. PM-2 TaxID=1462524 RepID=UPI00061C1409|nr:DEAD/DEAH box helicase [Paraliobacillus sp. PM-2]CQR46355.1 ATP-dependent RNA helicase DbpA [Paraliobacillus sp. PM-2]
MQSSFDGFQLESTILEALKRLEYTKPTDVQQEVIPHLLKDKDLIVQSKTGSGKTAAFAIPLCEKIEWLENKPQALVLTPTRELAQQIKLDITNIGRYKRVKAVSIFGKQSFEKQKLALKQKNHIVVGTPGRILDHLEKGTLPVESIQYLVIDEADELFNMGFIDQVRAIIEKMPTQRVTTLFSATFPEEVESICQSYLTKPLTIKLSKDNQLDNPIVQYVVHVTNDKKFDVLQALLITENPDSCIIFCRTQEQVDKLLKQLKTCHYPVEKIHGGMTQEDRFRVMDAFKASTFRYLVATDVAARGIDVANIPLILNFDIPLEKESYLHRIGRTGRAGRTGKAITFATNSEQRYVNVIEEYIGQELIELAVPSNERIKKCKDSFHKKISTKPQPGKSMKKKLDQDIMKLYFNGGKKKKIRALDFVGTIANIDGVSSNDIGIISIEYSHSYIEILNGKGPLVLDAMKHKTVKGKQLKVHKARE